MKAQLVSELQLLMLFFQSTALRACSLKAGMPEAPPHGPETLLSAVSVVLTATPNHRLQVLCWGDSGSFSWFSVTPIATFKNHSYTTNEFTAAAASDQCYCLNIHMGYFIFPFDYSGFGFLFALNMTAFKKKKKKEPEAAFPAWSE